MSDTTAKLDAVEPPECASDGCGQPAEAGDKYCWRCREEICELHDGKKDYIGATLIVLGLIGFGTIVVVQFFMRGTP